MSSLRVRLIPSQFISIKPAMVCLALLVLGACRSGKQAQSPYGQRTTPCPTSTTTASVRKDAYREYRTGNIQRAATIYEQGYQQALNAQNWCEAAWNLQNSAGCHHLMLHYRKAMQQYQSARPLALKAGDRDMQTMIASNLSSLYLQMGELGLAETESRQALSTLDSRTAAGTRAGLLVQVASAQALRGGMHEALPSFYEAINAASQQQDTSLTARVWDGLGESLRQSGRIVEADQALTEAYRIRRFGTAKHLPISYAKLGRLRRAQGDPASAEHLLSMAISASRRSAAPMPLWSMLYERGLAHRAQGEHWEALEDFRAARVGARNWRLQVLPAEAVRISTDVGLHQIYSAYFETASLLHFQTGRMDLARESYIASEENRAASLRESLSDLPSRLPDEYGAVLARLRNALSVPDSYPASQTAAWELRLTELEAQTGLHRSASLVRDPGQSLPRIQSRLGSDAALLSFSLGERGSYLWAITNRSFRALRLPPKREISTLVERFSEALRSGNPTTRKLGQSLNNMLLGQLPSEVQQRSQWKLELDDVLFGLPFSALVTQGDNGRPLFLIEKHSLEVLPAASLSQVRHSHVSTVFAGFGDPVYNRADDRFDERRAGRETRWSGMFFASADTPDTLELNRLTGSQAEIEACARNWRGARRITLGGDVTRQHLLQTLRSRPQVLHLALHVVQPPGSDEAQIALGLKTDGTQDLMGPGDIRTLQSSVGIVALSGCNSGRGRVLPAAGVVGLTRAWLQAGAQSVAASLWRVSDDDGHLFRKFYEHLPARDCARQSARALRAAQLEMLGSADWHADPRYWAAYFIVSRGLTE